MPAGCSSDTTLCLGDGRFLIDATWTKPDGESRPGHAVALTAESGYFWFLEPDNVEVAAKTLDGCAVNGRFWIFSAGLTNLAVRMTVTDTTTNQSRTYVNPQGVPFQTIADTTTFGACPAVAASNETRDPEEPREDRNAEAALPPSDGSCFGTDTGLCLGGRFLVQASWRTASGRSGLAQPITLTPESGYFWFFDPGNVELVVKTLNGCAIGRGWWFFAAGMTTVGVELRVTDTLTGEMRVYSSAAGSPFAPVLDTSAFSECPPPPPPQTYTVDVIQTGYPTHFRRFHFSPETIYIRAGDSIVWLLEGAHTTTSADWDSELGPSSFAHTFDRPGVFSYRCIAPHPPYLPHVPGVVVVDP
jgi:plastocyanin